MPCDMSRYPKNWREFRQQILARARMQCECTGQCDLHQPNPMPRRCCEIHHMPARWFKGTVRLTIAHLCHCEPPCATADHVIAACQRCHLRIDRFLHAAHRLKTQGKNTATMPADVIT